ncbi:MAG: lytic transglycosylase domain-containing protein [Oligoflexus sp.]
MTFIDASKLLRALCLVMFYGLSNKPAIAMDSAKIGQSVEFPMPQMVSYQTQFWYQIFSRYTSSQAVIHDVVYPNIIIDVIDFQAFAKRYNGGQAFSRKQRREIAERYQKRYEEAIVRIRQEGPKQAARHAMEKRVLSVYSHHPEGIKYLLKGEVGLRYQTGLADEFARAARRAQSYLPYMERIFRRHQVPTELTRIAFVESMFNESALSKVGASGIWQFMPATAKQFMLVNHQIDERNSPIKATEAAARLLASNYKRLKTWPLAITAYNHGAGGMSRAVRTIGTRDLGEIIKNYQSNSFGFASRNFYAEFLAARAVYETRYDHRYQPSPNPLNISNIKLTQPVSIHQLVAYTPLDEETIKRYNGCLSPKLFKHQRYQLLPRDFELIVPINLAHDVRAAMQRIIVSQNHRQGNRS